LHRAFYVDDEPLVLETFMKKPLFLENGFFNVGHSYDPFEAIKIIADTQPDVVFTDLKMPMCNGVEMMNKLRQSGYNGEFVIISAYREFEEARLFFKMDGFDYLVKPVSDSELLVLLEKLTNKLYSKKMEVKQIKKTPSPELNDIIEFLHKNMKDKHTLESVCTEFMFKPNYVCKLFSRYLSTTFTTYCTSIKMEEAAILLRTTQKSVKEISYICGYQDYFYFCRVFREIHSCTPSAFREGGA